MTAKIVSLNPEFVTPDSVGYSMTAARAFEVLQSVRMTQSNSYFCFEEPHISLIDTAATILGEL